MKINLANMKKAKILDKSDCIAVPTETVAVWLKCIF